MTNNKLQLSLVFLCSFACQLYGQQYQYQQYSYNTNSNVPAGRSFNCPDRIGRYPTGACDQYIECKEGIAEEKLCPDGLLFNVNNTFGYPCGYPIEVDCIGRSNVQPAQATEDCPHQFGYYKIGDSKSCGQFKNCANGIAYVFDCPEGLAFDETTYKCDWPDQVESCDAEAYLGFSCPNARQDPLVEEYRFFKSNDCQRYFLCVKGSPRLQRCGEGSAFEESANACIDAGEVPGCEHLRIVTEPPFETEKPLSTRLKNNIFLG